MLKHILATSIALVLSTAAIAANASDNSAPKHHKDPNTTLTVWQNFVNDLSNENTASKHYLDRESTTPKHYIDGAKTTPKHYIDGAKTTPKHHIDNSQLASFEPERTQPATGFDNSQPAGFEPEKTQPATGFDNSQPAGFEPEKTQPATGFDNSQPAGFEPEKTQPVHGFDNSKLVKLEPAKSQTARKLEPPESMPASNIQPIYQTLNQGVRTGIEINLDKCHLDDSSNTPDGIRFNQLFISANNGIKETSDPNGNANTVYQFSNSFYKVADDSSIQNVLGVVKVGPNTTHVSVHTSLASNQDGVDPNANTYSYTCDNSNVSSQLR